MWLYVVVSLASMELILIGIALLGAVILLVAGIIRLLEIFVRCV